MTVSKIISGTTINENNAIVASMIENKGKFIDGHSNKESGVSAVATFTKGNQQYIVPMYNSVFCINPLEIENGTVKLDRWSVGGVVYAGDSFESRIEQFNKNSAEYKNEGLGDGGQLSNLVKFF
jgi:hypothetical protein